MLCDFSIKALEAFSFILLFLTEESYFDLDVFQKRVQLLFVKTNIVHVCLYIKYQMLVAVLVILD